MIETTEAFSLDWEALLGGTVAFLKFLLGLYGVPNSATQSPPVLSAHEIVMVVRINEPHEIEATRAVIQNRLKALLLPSEEVEKLDSHLQIRTRLPENNDGLVGRLLAPGRVTVNHGGKTIIDSSDFERAEIWNPEGGIFGESAVKLILTEEGTKKWSQATAELVGQKCTIALDGKVLSSPTIMEKITAAEIVLTGPDIPRDLLLFYVNAGALPSAVELTELR